MLVYILVASILALFSNTKKRWISIAIYLLLLLISGFRSYNVGTDTMNYYDLYEGNATFTSDDLAFVGLFTLFKSIGLDYRAVLVFLSAITFLLLYIFAHLKTTRTVYVLFLFFLLGYCFAFYNVTRQMIAAILLLFAFYNREKNNSWTLFFIILIIATLVHRTAIVGIAIPFLHKMKIPGVYLSLVLLLTFVFPFIIPTNELMSTIISKVSFLERFDVYTDGTDKQLFSVNRLAMNIYFFYLANKGKGIKNDLYFKSAVFGLIILNLFPYSGVITRVATYFMLCQIVFFESFIPRTTKVNQIVAIGYCVVIFVFTMLNNIGGIVPYSFG